MNSGTTALSLESRLIAEVRAEGLGRLGMTRKQLIESAGVGEDRGYALLSDAAGTRPRVEEVAAFANAVGLTFAEIAARAERIAA